MLNNFQIDQIKEFLEYHRDNIVNHLLHCETCQADRETCHDGHCVECGELLTTDIEDIDDLLDVLEKEKI